jgi:predicted dehydrogenase
MSGISRRTFVGRSSRAFAAAAVAPATARPLGANDRVRIAVVGLHGRGRSHVREFSQRRDVEIVALCDVDESVFAPAQKILAEGGRGAARVERDFRRLIDDRSIDVLTFATPVHWYALGTIWACQGGKDVYVEKPLCHNLVEGRRMIEAARKYRRVVQMGTQRRSAAFLAEAAAYVRTGKLGKIGMARTWMGFQRPSIGHAEDGPAPKGVDYDLWLGPAPKRPFNRNRFHYEWHWNWDYGAGELGNNGVHALDMARALLGVGLPERVSSYGGTRVLKDDRQTPDTQIVTWEYPDLTLVWEHRQWSSQGLDGSPGMTIPGGAYTRISFGVALYGSQGTLVAHDNDWEVHHGDDVQRHSGTLGMPEHVANFLDCLRSRAKPNADVETGYLATALCHLGNIAYRLRRSVRFDPVRQRFVGDAEADALLGRTYRPPFVLPEKV